MVKKTKSSEKWGQLLASAIIILNPFVVLTEILGEIFTSLVVSEAGSPSDVIALCDVSLGVFVANIKIALGVFGEISYI
ncbi:hypothetical protein G9A89_007609 [Geosiphon pyriformis]|nr:hypothetical protein G9A89_007609 [Geosiphon pyriformis]